MKLHLPNGLRKALLACLAALALPTTLPSTLATASGIAAAWIGAAQPAMAEVTVTDHTGWDSFVQNQEQNKEGELVIIKQASQDPNAGIYFRDANDTVRADVRFDTDLFLNNGHSNNDGGGRTYTFSGAFTGEGSFVLGGGSIQNQHYVFTGDLSGWDGSLEITAGGGHSVEFSGANFRSSTNAVTVTAGGNSKLIVDGVTLNNSEITASSLEVRNKVTFNSQTAATINGATTFGAGASMTIGRGARVTVDLQGATTFGANVSWILEQDAKMTLDKLAAGSSTLSSLSLGNGSVLTLNEGVGVLQVGSLVSSGEAKIVVGSSAVSLDAERLSIGGRLEVDLTGLGFAAGWKYRLFTGAVGSDILKRVSFITGQTGLGAVLDEDGIVTLALTDSPFVYDGSGELKWGVGGGGWSGDAEWTDDGWNVNFTATEGTHSVSLTQGNLKAGLMDVAEGTAVYNITNGSASDPAVLSVGSLTVGKGVTMNFGEGTQLSIGSYLFMGEDAVLSISENMQFASDSPIFVGRTGSKITRAEGVTDPVYLELSLGGDVHESFAEYLKKVLGKITLENVGISKHGEGTLAFLHNPDTGYKGGADTIDVALDIAEGAVQFDGNTFTINKQVTGAGNLIIATASTEDEVMVHLVGGTNMTGTVQLSSWGARLGLGADSIVGGLSDGGAGLSGDDRLRVITGEKEDGNVKLTINVEQTDVVHRLTQVTISGVDIVKQGQGTQNLNMHFSGGSITVEGGILSTKVDANQSWSTLDAVSLSISGGATFHWEGASTEDRPVRDRVSGKVDIQGTFKIGDAIILEQGATIGETGKLTTTRDKAQVDLGADLVVSRVEALGTEATEANSAVGTLKKADIDGAAEHVHLQLSGSSQYNITNGVLSNINVDSSLGLYWRGNGGQLRVEGSTLDEVLVGGSGKLWFQNQVTLNGELKFAEGYAGGADVYVHNESGKSLTLKAGGLLKSVLNGGWGTYIDLGADFEVAGLQLKDAGEQGTLQPKFYNSSFEFAKYSESTAVGAVSLILNVTGDVTLNNTLTLEGDVNLEKRGAGTQTVTGKMVANGDVTVTEGTLALGGAASEINGALSGGGRLRVNAGGTLTLSGGGEFAGTLEMVDTSSITVEGKDLSVGTLSGTGSVTVGSGTLTVGTAGGATLSGLTLGQVDEKGNSTPGNLTVRTGSFTISGAWTWTEGSVLRLETAGQTITLDGANITPPTPVDEGDDTRLTVDLTEAFLGDPDGKRVQLFASGFDKAWKDYFRFAVNGQYVDDEGYEGPYKGMELNSKGVLRWGAEDVYWVVDQSGESLEWDDKSGKRLFNVNEDGSGKLVAWTDDSDVSFVVRDSGATGPHTVTLNGSNGSINTGDFYIGGSTGYTFTSKADSAQTLAVGGDLEVDGGVTLTFEKNVRLEVDAGVDLGTGSKLTLNSDMVFGGKLSGDAGSIAGSGTVYALWGNDGVGEVTWDDFAGRYDVVLGSGVGYGVSMSEADLTVKGDATLDRSFKVEGKDRTLTFSDILTLGNYGVTVGEGATLALGGGVGGKGTITGTTGTLRITGGNATFAGTIEVKDFFIEGGTQVLAGGSVVRGTVTLTGGKLQLGNAAGDTLTMPEAVVKLAPGSAEAAGNPLLSVVGDATISKLYGTGQVGVSGKLTLSGYAEETEVFTGKITGAGMTQVTGTLRLGNDASVGNLTVETVGTVNVQEGEVTVGQLAGDGAITGAGTLELTGGGSFGGKVESSRFTYAGNGTFELTAGATIGDSTDVRVEKGTLKVSGAETVPGVTLAGGTLDAAKDGLTVSSLTLEGEASGLKVTSNLTVGEVKGDGALGSLNIGTDAGLTVQSGNLTLNGQLSWGSGATLTLGRDYQQKFVWGPKFGFGLEGGHLKVRLWERYLRGLKKDVDSFLGLGVDWKAEWAGKIDVELIDDTRNRYQDLRLREEDGNLTWTRKGVQWDGGENNGTWTDSGTVGEGWNKVDSDEEADNTPGGQDVYFIGESGATGTEEVVISGTVAPTNVYVESGNYEFAGDGHIQMAADGVLTVGGDPKGATRLKLSNANTNLPFIELQEDGFLVLNNDGALTSPSQDKPDTAKTKIRFMGGTLEFGEKMTETDVSSHVAEKAAEGSTDGSTDAARVNVGEGKNVTWGSEKTEVGGNGGLTLILNQTGLEKSGEGEFTLAWKETGGEHEGAMTVNAGTLTLSVANATGEAIAVLNGAITGDGTLNVSQGNLTLSGKNTVKSIVLAGGNTTLGSDTALGNKNTELTLSGGGITGGTGTVVNAGRVNVEGSSTVNGTVTFSGTVNGEGTLTAGTGASVTLSGGLKEFTGTLNTGTGGTITLSGPDTEVGATVVGSGTLDVNSAEGVTLVGAQLGNGGNLTVKNSGKGDLVIASRPCDGLGLSFGASAGRIVLGDAGHAITVSTFHGVTGIGTGDVVLSNVTLSPGKFSKGNARLFVETAVPGQGTAGVRAIDEGAAATVYVDGMDASELDGITVNEDGLLAGVSGTYNVGSSKQLTLHFTAANMGIETDKSKITRGLIEGGKDFRIEFSGGDAEAQGFHLEFDETALVAALRGRSNEEIPLYLLALRGGEWDAATKGVQVDWSKSGLLDIVVTEYGFKEDGLWIKGSTKDLYIVMDDEKSDPAVSTSPEVLERRLATVVTEGQTLTLNWAGGNGTVHNLLGGPNATLNINDTSNAGLTVTLDNAKQPPSGEISDSRYPDPTPAVGPDTTFDGTILGGKGVNIRKTGTGTLTVGGDYTLEDGYTRLEAGALRLRGASNHMGSLTFAYSGSGTEERGLLLEGGDTSIGSIVEDPKAGSSVGNKVSLTNGAGLKLTGKSTLASTAITGDEKSTVELGDGAGLSLTGEAKIDGIVVEVGDGAALDFGATTASKLAELNGGGTLKSAADGKVTVSGGSFSGTLGSSAEGGKAGVLAVEEGASFTLDNAKSVASAPDKGMDVQLGKGSGLTVNVGEKSGTASDTLVLGDISIGDGHLTLDFGEESVGRDFVRGNITSVGPDGSIKFESAGKVTNGTVGTGLTVDSTAWKELLDSVEYGGLGFFRKDVTADKGEDGKELVLKIEDAQRNKLTEALKEDAQGSEKNALAGAVMVWGAFLARPEGETRPGSDFDAMTDNLADRVTSGNTAGLAGTLAAAAGASISTLGPALAEDLHRQLTSIRNRTTTMANEVRDGAGTRFPLRHAWIDAETGYHELDSDGLAPGYKLTGWGGTVGADFDMSRHLTAGLAFTAMYGDLDADAADSATGDMDTCYLSAFARVSSGSWIHSFVLSGGVADVELNRTVNYGGFSPYRTNGSTDGYALGFLYEVGYTGLVNRQGTAALQPVFNVEVRHIALKGYTESGSDAGVDVDDIDQTVLTFGAGARAQFAVGAHAFNRAAVLETRALLKADMGDRSGSVSNAIIGSATRAEVESAEVGAVGVEAGVGITVPFGPNAGSVFLDGSFEFREGWTSANATLGYRINF